MTLMRVGSQWVGKCAGVCAYGPTRKVTRERLLAKLRSKFHEEYRG